MTSTHGLDQSQRLTLMAQNLSEARINLRESVEQNPGVPFPSAEDAVESAKMLYDLAYTAYTNPFRVQKTVDARWPNVPK